MLAASEAATSVSMSLGKNRGWLFCPRHRDHVSAGFARPESGFLWISIQTQTDVCIMRMLSLTCHSRACVLPLEASMPLAGNQTCWHRTLPSHHHPPPSSRPQAWETLAGSGAGGGKREGEARGCGKPAA